MFYYMTVLQPTVEFDLPCCQHLYLIKQGVKNIPQIPMNKNKSTANCANAHLSTVVYHFTQFFLIIFLIKYLLTKLLIVDLSINIQVSTFWIYATFPLLISKHLNEGLQLQFILHKLLTIEYMTTFIGTL